MAWNRNAPRPKLKGKRSKDRGAHSTAGRSLPAVLGDKYGFRFPTKDRQNSRIVHFGEELAAASKDSQQAVFRVGQEFVREGKDHRYTPSTMQNYMSLIRSVARTKGADMDGEPMEAWRLSPEFITELNRGSESRKESYARINNGSWVAKSEATRAPPWKDTWPPPRRAGPAQDENVDVYDDGGPDDQVDDRDEAPAPKKKRKAKYSVKRWGRRYGYGKKELYQPVRLPKPKPKPKPVRPPRSVSSHGSGVKRRRVAVVA